MIELQVNGEQQLVVAGSTLFDLIERLELVGQRIAIEVNQEIIPRSQHGEYLLKAGDAVEVVQAIGGG
jgi:sulfur carrier protein